jgi:patatin-like phospholipase/acyl hydrolase
VFDSLLFSGGGTRGIAFSGALNYYLEQGVDWGQSRPKLKCVGGVSIGSLFALLIAIGYSCKEIAHLAQTIDVNCFVTLDVTRILLQNQVSLDSGSGVEEFLTSVLMQKLKCGKLTLKQLEEKTGIKLNVFVTHLDSGKLECVENTNDVVDAIRASMSLPPMFPPQLLLRNGRREYFADGAIVNNFPMMRMPPTTLGFNLVQKKYCVETVLSHPNPFLPYLALALDIAIPRPTLNEEEEKRTVHIECGSTHGSYELHLSECSRQKLVQEGYAATKARNLDTFYSVFSS